MQHVTLATGDVRRSPREEVSRSALKIARRLTHEGGRLPAPFANYEIKWTAPPGDGCCVYTVSRVRADGELIPLVTCGVALDDGAGAQLWQILLDTHRKAVRTESPAHRPGAPWCGVVLWPTALLDVGSLAWLGDFERCLAWAWVEKTRGIAR